MEIADQDNKKINKVIFNVLYENINCMYNCLMVFTLFSGFRRKTARNPGPNSREYQ